MNEQDKNDGQTSDRPTALNKSPGQTPPRIVIAEDDEEMAALLVRAFGKAGYEVSACHTGWDLLRILGVFPAGEAYKDVDLVISDIRLPGISGLDVLKACGYISGAPPIILITAFGADWIHVEAEKLGAVDMVDKPFDIDDFVVRVGEFFLDRD